MFMRTRLQVEELAQRILPATTSVQPLFPLFPFATTAPLPATSPHALAGEGQGAFLGNTRLFATTAITDTLTGTAFLNRLGDVTLAGTIHGVGGVAVGRATGTLTFRNTSGSVTVRLTGPLQTEFAALPQQFTYAVVGGTGAYTRVTDTGTLTLTLAPAAPGTTTPTLVPPNQGTFTMTLAGGIAVQPPPQINSGITGAAVVGPISPVSTVGTTNAVPLAGAVIVIEPAGGGPVLARVTTAANGSFKVALPPGQYLVLPQPPRPGALFPHAVTNPIVTVQAGTYTSVLVSYDSGIR
jgi:hypothetical protein